MSMNETSRVVPLGETGRWLVLDKHGQNDGWNYPSKEAAEDARKNPDWWREHE